MKPNKFKSKTTKKLKSNNRYLLDLDPDDELLPKVEKPFKKHNKKQID